MSLQVYVDWNHDGDFSDTNETLTGYVLAAEWRIGRRQPHDIMPAEGTATLTLDNRDRRFSTENSAGPLYGELRPGCRIKITLDDGSGEQIMWYGWLDSIMVEGGRYGERRAVLYGTTGFDRLAATPARLPVQSGTTADTIIAQALTRSVIGASIDKSWVLGITGELDTDAWLYVPAEQFDPETGITEFVYAGDHWQANTSVAAVIGQVVAAEDGLFWQGRDGVFHFRNRHYRMLDVSLAVDLDLDAAAVSADYSAGEQIVSGVRVTCYPRELSAPDAVIWTSLEPLRVPESGSRDVRVTVDETGNGRRAALSVEPPLPETDFTAVDDFGIDRTYFLTVEAVREGGAIRVNFYNRFPQPLYVSLQIRGQTLTRYNALTVEVLDTETIGRYGRRLLELDLPAFDNPDAAVDFARWLLTRYRQARGQLARIRLGGTDNATLAWMIDLAMGVRVQVDEYQTATASREYLIMGEEFSFSPAEGMVADYVLLPADTDVYWRLNYGTLTTDTTLAY